MRFPLLAKFAALAAVTIALLAALGAVDGVVAERQRRQAEAQQGIADSLAAAQTLLGPLLRQRCEETWEHSEGEGKWRRTLTDRTETWTTHAPKRLAATAQVALDPRYRGLFKVNGYLARHTLSADWAPLTAPQPNPEHRGARVQCEAPVLAVALGDARGIRSADVAVSGRGLPVLPGSALAGQPRGLHAVLVDAAAGDAALHADINLELAGTGSLAFAPIGDETVVDLQSDWPHPSFAGRFLPVARQVGAAGFEAQWKVSALASSAQQAQRDGAGLCELRETGEVVYRNEAEAKHGCLEIFGVQFIDPVNPYVLSDRALKYGLLFIVLTFVGVALVEVLRRLRVHPVQYLLVGCALTVFFLLLVSLGEHLSFGIAYLCASGACTALLGYYGCHVLKGLRPGLVFGAGIALLYGALYALLQLEQTALVLGSLLLFAVLAAVMVATRRIDWYALAAQLREPARA